MHLTGLFFVTVAGATIPIILILCLYGGTVGRSLLMTFVIESDFVLGYWLNSFYSDVNTAIGFPIIFYLWLVSILIRFKVVYLPYLIERR